MGYKPKLTLLLHFSTAGTVVSISRVDRGKKKLATRKMNISVSNREKLEVAWKGLVFARTRESFERRQRQMEELCNKISVEFLSYLKTNWYDYCSMWATLPMHGQTTSRQRTRRQTDWKRHGTK